MKNKLPTYEECCEISDVHGSLVFYRTNIEIDGYLITMFNYRLASYNNLVHPLPDAKPDLSAIELRGICFVLDSDGMKVLDRFIMLNKFWNLNETSETQYDVVKNYVLKAIHNKEDGSMVRFMRLPNGKVLSKTKGSVDNEICVQCNKLYTENNDIKMLVNWSLDNNLALIFEYVSPFNKIVLDYKETKLILLKARDNNDGSYLDVDSILMKFNAFRYGSNIHHHFIDTTIDYREDFSSITELMTLSQTVEDKEGWVINLLDENGVDYFVKLKTKWYFERHKLLTEDIVREDFIISKILNETIDDIICQLTDKDIEIRNKIQRIDEVVKSYIQRRMTEVQYLISVYNEQCNGDKKTFALAYSKDINFSHVMNVVNGKLNVFESVCSQLEKECSKLNTAIKFIQNGML